MASARGGKRDEADVTPEKPNANYIGKALNPQGSIEQVERALSDAEARVTRLKGELKVAVELRNVLRRRCAVARRVRLIVETVAEHGVSSADILGPRRFYARRDARQRLIQRMRDELNMTFSAIGQALNRDRSAIINAYHRSNNTAPGAG